MNIGLIQMACSANPAENLERALFQVEEVAKEGAQVICLPELFQSQYFCQVEDAARFDLAESIPGPTTEAFGQIAKRHSVTLLLSIFERRAAGLYHNSLVVMDDQGVILGLYRKMHIPDDPAYYEKYYFTPGDRGFQAIKTPHAVVGPMICWDQWYPEAARMTVLQGAEILFYPTAIGWHPKEKADEGSAQREAWMTIQRGHAISNGVFVVAVNRVGHEIPAGGDGLEFWGSSFVCDPFGVILEQGSVDREERVIVEVDLKRIEDIRRHWPFLRDRRIDAYGGLTQRLMDERSPTLGFPKK